MSRNTMLHVHVDAFTTVSIQLLGIMEISELLEVAPATVSKWIQREILPEPDVELGIGKIWNQATIEQWARATNRLLD